MAAKLMPPSPPLPQVVASSSSFHGQICSVSYPPSVSSSHVHLLPVRRPNPVQKPPLTVETSSVQFQPIDLPTISPLSIKKSRTKSTKKRKNGASCSTTDVLRLMDGLGLPVAPEIYDSLMKECAQCGDSLEALELQRHLRRSGLKLSMTLLNRLLLMHVARNRMDTARQLFDEMHDPDFLSWAILIVGYAEDGDYEESLRVFIEMSYRSGMRKVPSFVVGSILKSCASTMNVELGKQVHGWVLKVGYSNNDHVPARLIDFYSKFESWDSANIVFNQTSRRDKGTWTAKIISGCREKRFKEVIDDFRDMGRAGIRINKYTYSSILKASSRLKDDGKCGKQIHAKAIKIGVESRDLLQHRLVEMYGKSGLVGDARKVCDVISSKSTRKAACWNAMVKGYVEHGHAIDAIKLLYEMKALGMQCKKSLVNEVRILAGS